MNASIFQNEITILAVIISVITCLSVLTLIYVFSKVEIRINFIFPSVVSKGDVPAFEVHLKNKKILPYRKVKICFTLTNELTGEKTKIKLSDTLGAKESTILTADHSTMFSGLIRVSETTLFVYDFFGITHKKAVLDNEESFIVLPSIYDTSIRILENSLSCIDEDEYSRYTHGDDYSEVFDFRDYEYGDKPNTINWKLSEKYDHLIVKRGSLPIVQSIVIALSPKKEYGESNSLLADSFASICEALTHAHTKFTILYNEGERNIFYEIEREEDLSALLPRLLSAKPLLEVDELEYAHILCVGDALPLDSAEDNRLTHIDLSLPVSSGGSNANRMILINEENIASELSYIEI